MQFFNDSTPEEHWGCLQFPNIFLLLPHMPWLQFLELTVHDVQKSVCPLNPHLLDRLSTLLPPIEVLNIHDMHCFHSTLVYGLVGICPTIQALRLMFPLPRHERLLPERPSISLGELRLQVPDNYLATEIKWFPLPPPPNEWSRLLFLELPQIPGKLLPMLSINGPSISSLRLTSLPEFKFAHLFTKLEELVIMVRSRWTRPFPAFAAMRTCLNLLQLRLYMWFPDLHVLSIPEYFSFTAHRFYSDILHTCKTHKVYTAHMQDSQSRDPDIVTKLFWRSSGK